jgi:hypothetical protein
MAKKITRSRPWTKQEVRMLRTLTREKTKMVIARKLKRSANVMYGLASKLARIMHHMPRFCMPGPHAYCTRMPSIRPVWIGVHQLAVQRVWV